MTAMKRIILTGASGFVGQHVLQALMQHPTEYEVYALYRDTSNGFAKAVQDIFPPESSNVHLETLDLTDEEAVDAWISSHSTHKLDLCIHLAAMSNPRVCEQHPEQAYACNNPTHWFRALSSRNIPIVALSTDQVYDGRSNELYTELDPPNPVNVYGKSKVAMEGYLRKHCACYILLRSSIVLGALAPLSSHAHDTFLHFCATRVDQKTDFYTDEIRSVVSIKNVVQVLLYFCKNGVTTNGVYNMGGPDAVSRYDMARGVFDHFGYSTECLSPKIKASLPVQSASVRSPLDISMDSTKLEKVVGFRFRGFKEMVQGTFPNGPPVS